MKLTVLFIILTFAHSLLPSKYDVTKLILLIIMAMICGYKIALI